jgi:3-dehydroquinate synthase
MHQIAHGGDPFEFGSVRPLDFGHWSAHKIESLTRYHVRHGEAVAIGIALDARYSVLAGHLEPGHEERIAAVLEHLGFALWHPVLDKRDADGKLAVIEGLEEFRQHLGGELTLTLLTDIGTGMEVHAMDDSLVEQSIAWLKSRAGDKR